MNDDIFNVLGREIQNIEYNIVVLQYVISDILEHKTKVEMSNFISNLVTTIICKMKPGSIIIINDINLSDTREYFDLLFNCAANNEIEGMYWTYSFKNDYKSYFRHGVEYNSNDILFDVPKEIREYYNPWLTSSSTQIIIREDS